MLLGLAISSWLLTTSVSGASLPVTGARVINDRVEYWKHARSHGMCDRVDDETENQKRLLVVPGENILSSFDVCVAKNEFGEALYDNSGLIFCHGQAIHLMADAMNYKDSKDFVDRATELSGTVFNEKLKGLVDNARADSFTVEYFLKWTKALNFVGAGKELGDYENSRFPSTPEFINRIRPQARLFSAWSKIVHHYWHNLDRNMTQMHKGYLIPGPGSVVDEQNEKYSTSLIRLDHPFVVAGGRFREQYYWDSFFIMEGLLAANVTYLARTTLLNFMDEIKAYGFIPNGGRKYYLNRSQPPLFISMLHAYVDSTGDKQILHEALPLAERELRWWYKYRSVNVRHAGQTYRVFRYNVNATGPRPESYAEDWRSVWCQDYAPPTPEEANELYSEFASGAETGWDYTARWMRNSFNQTNREHKDQMRDLRVRKIIPVDLNSILYRSYKLMAQMYEAASTNESPFAIEYSRRYNAKAKRLGEAILALHWDPQNLAFFDFVLDENPSNNSGRELWTGSIHRFWSGASMVPYWAGIWPREFGDCSSGEQKKAVMKGFSGVRDLLERYPGPLPSTLVETGQQWDFPNSWPPLQYFTIKALESINNTCIAGTSITDFSDIARPENHLGEREPPKRIEGTPEIDYSSSPFWNEVLTKTVVMRYMNAAYCTWNEMGQLPSDRVELIVRDNPRLDPILANHTGNMYEKLNAKSATKSGRGGEYEVQTGFGWTNGVAIWIAQNYGAILDNPNCTSIAREGSTKAVNPELEREETILFQY